MLSGRIAQIPQIDMPLPDGGTMPLNIACHTATCYWLYHEAYGTPPQPDEFLNKLGDVSGLATELAKMGTRVKKSNIKKLWPGTVLIFCDLYGNAKHSCVIANNGIIGGYNQLNWFSSPGASHAYSTHAIGDIVWKGVMNKRVQLNTEGSQGRLIAVDETKAVDFIRTKTS